MAPAHTITTRPRRGRWHPCRGADILRPVTGGVAALNHRLQAVTPLVSIPQGRNAMTEERHPFHPSHYVFQGGVFVQLFREHYRLSHPLRGFRSCLNDIGEEDLAPFLAAGHPTPSI